MYLAYTYYICNKITNQFYYGSRYKNINLNRTPEEDFWVYYFTSSKKVKKLIEMYGKESFEIEIINRDPDYVNIYWFEQDKIKENISDTLCLNSIFIDKDSNERMFSAPAPGYKMSSSCKGDNHYMRQPGYVDPRKGRKATPEQILKNSERHKGIASKYKDAPRDEDTKLKLKQTYRKKYDEEGYVSPRKNAVWSDEYKKTKSEDMRKFYETHSWPEYIPVVCPHCGKEGKGNSMLRWHFDNCKNKEYSNG